MEDSALEKGEYALLNAEEDDENVENDKEDEKDSEHKSLMWQSVSNLVSDIEGTGLLALPYVIQRGGLVAVVGLAVVPFICYHTGKILIECLYAKDTNNTKVNQCNCKKTPWIIEACYCKQSRHLLT